MIKQIKQIAQNVQSIGYPVRGIVMVFRKLFFRGSKKYWESRYRQGGTSGAGSYGMLADFKAEVLNGFVKEHRISSVIEFGCGDGNQLALAEYPAYIGFDVSMAAIEICKQRYSEDRTKKFFLVDPECFVGTQKIYTADLALSLDVIYHLIEDRIFDIYMKNLFGSAEKFVIIYSINSDEVPSLQPPHIKYRKFSNWINVNMSEWKLLRKVPNNYSFEKDHHNESISDFFIYGKDVSEI